jgi:UDPglucose 6-dehydrogenase
MDTKYSVIGLGKLGCSMAAAIASKGFEVVGVDISKHAVDLVNKGFAPVPETDLEKTIQANKSRLQATLSHTDAILNSEISFVIVPTPSDDKGAFSLQYAKWAFREIGCALKEKETYHLVVLTSTVLPGSTRYGLLSVLEKESGKKCGKDFGLCYSPEFIALGSIIKDFLNPDFTLVGEFDKRSGDVLEESYANIMSNSPPCRRMSLENAELTKVALNTFVTTKISYANMLSELCEKIPGGDVDIVTNAIGSDSRVGKKYLTGALGYGGPCFPRDNRALGYLAKKLDVNARIAETTDKENNAIVPKAVAHIQALISPSDTVAVLGMAYKPSSYIIEESQGAHLADSLAKSGVRVVTYDPLAAETVRNEFKNRVVVLDSLEECLKQAKVFLVTTADPEFKQITVDSFDNKDVIVFDFWRILDEELSNKANIEYYPTGRSLNDNENARILSKLWQDG